MIRTLQDRGVHSGIDVFMECTITRLLKDGDRVAGAFGYWRADGRFLALRRAGGRAGDRRHREGVRQITSNSWEYTGDGHALAYEAGAELIDMEFVQFHPTGMVWPPGVRGLLVTEAVRGEGGILRNKEGERFMERYLQTAATSTPRPRRRPAAGSRRSSRDADRRAQPPELSTRDIVARAIYTEVREGRGTRTAACSSTSRTWRAEHVRKKLPSMYDQFKELADVDITAEPMEVGPTCHYMMGGVRVDAETGGQPASPASSRRASARAGCTAPTGSAATRSRDLLVFGRRAGAAAAAYATEQAPPPTLDGRRGRGRRRRSSQRPSIARRRGSVRLHAELQDMMQTLRRHLPRRGRPASRRSSRSGP